MTAEFAGASEHAAGSLTHRVAGHRGILRSVVGGLSVLALVGAMAGTAAAAPGDTSPDTTVANVGVSSSITLTGLPGSFTMNGIPGSTVSDTSAVSFTVTTNNVGGYSVGVLAARNVLLPPIPGGAVGQNPDSIPIANLAVREAGTTAYESLSSVTPVVVHNSAGQSIPAGDVIANDYRVVIPTVRSDTYSVTLDYVATAL